MAQCVHSDNVLNGQRKSSAKSLWQESVRYDLAEAMLTSITDYGCDRTSYHQIIDICRLRSPSIEQNTWFAVHTSASQVHRLQRHRKPAQYSRRTRCCDLMLRRHLLSCIRSEKSHRSVNPRRSKKVHAFTIWVRHDQCIRSRTAILQI